MARNVKQHNTPSTTRRDVAMQYFESTCPRQAVARMNRWLKQDPTLRKALHEVGYRDGTHYFSEEVVKVFDYFFG